MEGRFWVLGFGFFVFSLREDNLIMVGKKIDERTFDFALMIVDVYKFLLGKKEFVLSKQCS